MAGTRWLAAVDIVLTQGCRWSMVGGAWGEMERWLVVRGVQKIAGRALKAVLLLAVWLEGSCAME
jgi:hypothetical protein